MAGNRFESILKNHKPSSIYDVILMDLDKIVVTPTLGSIVPNWLLAIPRTCVVNFAAHGTSPSEVVASVASRLNLRMDQVIWFEHGSSAAGSAVGCGVDYAHLHILVEPAFDFDTFKNQAVARVSLPWREGRGNCLSSLPVEESYLVAGSGDEFIFATSVEVAGSQFFRKIVAELVGQPTRWNYKEYPHIDNVNVTVASFSRVAA
jgi:hypothetical protein